MKKWVQKCTLWLIILVLSTFITADELYALENVPWDINERPLDAETKSQKPILNPQLKFPTLQAYEAECGEEGLVLDDERIKMFAPMRKKKEATIIFSYLIRACEELYRIVGVYPKYKLVVYHFPEGSKYAKGGTSNCTIWYSYKNLDLESQKEWTEHQVPHLSGYIEEMAHNFDSAAGAQFGWEMVGWNLGVKVTQTVGDNPIFRKQVADTRVVQKDTFTKYVINACKLPKRIPPNLCDRVHAYLLWICEQRYGQDFWADFFKEIQNEQQNLKAAASIRDPDRRRNRKYQISVDCFDRLKKIKFKKLLIRYQISLDTAVKSLRPTEPEWDRKLVAKAVDHQPYINIESFPALHQAAYGGHSNKAKKLIDSGYDINSKAHNNWTPLHMAAMEGHRLMVQLLLDEGANIWAMDDKGQNAAQLAQIGGHKELAKFLQETEDLTSLNMDY